MDITGPQALKRARANAGLSQQDLAVKLSVSLPSVSQWERGITTPRRTMAERIDKALGAGGAILEAFGYSVSSQPVDVAALQEQVAHLTREVQQLAALVAALATAQGQAPAKPRRPAR